MQNLATECGAACLGSILAYFGRWVSLNELREACMIGRDGCSAAEIVEAARSHGLEVEAWRKEPEELHDMPLPSILFWGFNHFVVLEGISNKCYYLNDPGSGRRTVSSEDFNREFTGVVMTMQPGSEFRRGGIRPGVVRNFWPWLRDVKSAFGFAALSGLLLALSGLILPILLSLFVDHVLSDGAVGTLFIPTIAIIAGLGVFLLTWLHHQCLRRLAIRLSIVHTDKLLSHLFRLPLTFFHHRFVGDIIQRIRLVDKVAFTGSMQVVGIGVELVMSIFFLVLMLIFEPILALLVAGIGIVSIILTKLVSSMRTDVNRQMQREQGMLDGTGMFGLSNITSLRAVGKEDELFARWAGYQARELLARQKFSELGYLIAAIPGLTLALGSAAVLGLGGWKAMSGDLTIGQLMGFYVVASNFLRPIGEFVMFADMFQTMEADLQRIDEIQSASSDQIAIKESHTKSQRLSTLDGRLRLNGQIELRNVTFGYQHNRQPLIKDLNLEIEIGQRVALIGPSGSGKSTILMLLSGVYSPWSGEILLDGVPISEIPNQVITSSLSLIDQRICLFDGTVRDNLTMWNPAIPDEQLIAAAKDALIHDIIVSRTRGYDSSVDENGRNFSGGQRQRLEIARALVKNPTVILMDEATSALDTLSERKIDDAVRKRGCTSLIVAHRLSTIRDCDLILVLEKGKEIQRGTHDELAADIHGLYYRLFHAEAA